MDKDLKQVQEESDYLMGAYASNLYDEREDAEYKDLMSLAYGNDRRAETESRERRNRALEFLNLLTPWNLWENYASPLSERRLNAKAEDALGIIIGEMRKDEEAPQPDPFAFLVVAILITLVSFGGAFIFWKLTLGRF